MLLEPEARPACAGKSPLLGHTIQWGYVVRDLEAAMRHWTEVMHVGPFIHILDIGRVETIYRGKPTEVRLNNAFTYYGDIQIEIIEQLNDAPSPYIDFLATGQEGLQHIGFWVPDFEAKQRELEAGGFEAIYSARLPGAAHPSIYFEGPHMGALTELAWATPQKAQLYAAMKKVVREWDGERPVRRYADMKAFADEQGVPSWTSAP